MWVESQSDKRVTDTSNKYVEATDSLTETLDCRCKRYYIQ